MSTQGPFGLKNPFVTCESSFGGYFWLGGDSIFLDCWWVDRGCVRWRIHGSPLETFSVRISERAPTMFFFIVSESTGVACAEEFMRHLGKQFRRLFLSGQRLNFPWLFISQQGLCGLTNPFVTCESTFEGYLWVDNVSVFLDCLWVNRGCVGWRIIRHLWQQFRGLFLSGHRLSFPWRFLCQQVLCDLRIPSDISGNSFRDDFSVVSDSVFLDIFWVNRCCARWGFLLSSLETVYVTISDWSGTQFSLTFSESTGAVRAEDSFCHLSKQFPWRFLSGQQLIFLRLFLSQQVLCSLRIPSVISGNSLREDFWLVRDSVFLDVFWVNRCCARWGFLLSSLETVSVTISEWSATQFSIDFFWVNRCCASWGFLLSSLETVYVKIFDWSGTQFSLTFSESTGAVRAEDSFSHLWKQFPWWFLSGQQLNFPSTFS